ncbi:Cytochrome c oxidase subunit 2 precursor [Planctomycetes bacterium MalM25]|nr:Cytochrome c oxidase subunit 2 precursor [Planctomycetes bacterium MalM25]
MHPAPLLNVFDTPLPLAAFGIDWFRDAASTQAAKVDTLYFWILAICIVFFVLIVGLMIVFMARYAARPGHVEEHTSHHNNALEAAWSIFPGFLTVGIFWFGFLGYLDLRTPPDNAYEIQVVAKKWNWSFVYPSGYIDSNLHVPADRPVKLIMSSDDVLHSLFIPAFRVKMDVVPGRYSKLWFEATTPTESFDEAIEAKDTRGDVNGYDLFCTEYCGEGHSAMIAKVIVHESEAAFEKWLVEADVIELDSSPVELGQKLWLQRGCKQCHSIDGKKGTGPSWQGTFGTEQDMTKGDPIEVDENYIRKSILEPMADIRAGYKGVMPSYKGQIKEAEIAALIWFIKSLKEGEEVPATWEEAGGVPGQETEEEAAEGEAPADEAEPAAEAPAEDAAPAKEPAKAA